MFTNKKIGIMQGRLSPSVEGKIQAFPSETWKDEFYIAKECGFSIIDWILEERELNSNPLLTDDGLKEIKSLVQHTGVSVGAVCADYFMEYPLIRCSDTQALERIDALLRFARRMSAAGISYFELPYVDNSAIRTSHELEQLIRLISPVLDKSQDLHVQIAFETSLSPDVFKKFLTTLNHPAVKVNYDMGNSASLGYRPEEELSAYGDYIVTVHVKDRIRGGGTVPLGTGDTDFETCFSMLKNVGYDGPYILQAARGPDEINWNKRNRDFILNYLE